MVVITLIIEPKTLDNSQINITCPNATYDGTGKGPIVNVGKYDKTKDVTITVEFYDKDGTKINGLDENNYPQNAGEYRYLVTVTGKGNYKGNITRWKFDRSSIYD